MRRASTRTEGWPSSATGAATASRRGASPCAWSPRRALSFRPYGELAVGYDAVAAVAPLPSPDLTQPNFLVEPSDVSREVGDRAGQVVNLREA